MTLSGALCRLSRAGALPRRARAATNLTETKQSLSSGSRSKPVAASCRPPTSNWASCAVLGGPCQARGPSGSRTVMIFDILSRSFKSGEALLAACKLAIAPETGLKTSNRCWKPTLTGVASAHLATWAGSSPASSAPDSVASRGCPAPQQQIRICCRCTASLIQIEYDIHHLIDMFYSYCTRIIYSIYVFTFSSNPTMTPTLCK